MNPFRPNTAYNKVATRLAFFIAGFSIACWAPLVPFAKSRLELNDGQLGSLLLCLGLGSLVAMPMAGGLASRLGSRPVIVVGALGVAAMLPLMASGESVLVMGLALAIFGACLGALDVAANIHGLEVQKTAGTPMMSNFHGMYSLGGLIGAAGVTRCLMMEMPPLTAAWLALGVIVLCCLMAIPGLLSSVSGQPGAFFVRPRGVVTLMGVLTFFLFMMEGAILDWSAVFLNEYKAVPEEQAGVGFVRFALAMVVGRFTGDRLVAWLGPAKVFVFGAVLSAAGLALMVFSPWALGMHLGFLLLGGGSANLVPILFSRAGDQKLMPPDMAIAAVSVMGYAGVLIGPAGIGWISESIGLNNAFVLLGVICLAVALPYRVARPH